MIRVRLQFGTVVQPNETDWCLSRSQKPSRFTDSHSLGTHGPMLIQLSVSDILPFEIPSLCRRHHWKLAPSAGTDSHSLLQTYGINCENTPYSKLIKLTVWEPWLMIYRHPMAATLMSQPPPVRVHLRAPTGLGPSSGTAARLWWLTLAARETAARRHSKSQVTYWRSTRPCLPPCLKVPHWEWALQRPLKTFLRN